MIYAFLALLSIILIAKFGFRVNPQNIPGAIYAALFLKRGWVIGPWIKGKQYSKGYGARLKNRTFEFSTSPRSHIHYLTRNMSGGAFRTIYIDYEIIYDSDTRFIEEESGKDNTWISLFMQREGDNWDADEKTNFYRWWLRRPLPLKNGRFKIIADVYKENWTTPMQGLSSLDYPEEFVDAVTNIERAGITFGGPNGLGHGVYTDKPATFILHHFEVRQ